MRSWLRDHPYATAAWAAIAAAAVRMLVIFVTWPTCAQTHGLDTSAPKDGCFKVWGDALYSSSQGVLNGRGHLYKNGLEWLLSGYKPASAGDPPFFSGFLGLVAWYGSSHTPLWIRIAVSIAVLGGGSWLAYRYLPIRWRVAAIGGIIAVLLLIARLGGEHQTVQRVIGALFGCVAVYFIVLCANELGGPTAAVVVGVIAVAHPLLWINDIMLMSESPYLAFLAAGLWATLKYWRSPSWRWALVISVTLAFAASTRAESATLFPLLVLPLFLRARGLEWRTKLLQLGAAALIASAVLGPWLGWNSVRFNKGNITTMTTGTGTVLGSASCDATYYGDALGYWSNCIFEPYTVTAGPNDTAGTLVARALHTDNYNDPAFAMCGVKVNGATVTNEQQSIPAATKLEVSIPRHPVDPAKCPTGAGRMPPDESEFDWILRHMATDYISAHKSRLPTVAVLRVARMMDLFRPFDTWRMEYSVEGRGYWTALVGMVMWWAMGIPAIIGLVVLWRKKLPVWPFVAIVLAIAITAAGTFGVNRYRVPADMVEIILFSVAVAALESWIRGRRARTTMTPAP